ncbi:glycosyltransferase family 2 protein [Luxibacter massiliensis]|uniref:glycosyltransferase family 2 protein n=1 Tax=Luxibacter massiliensis TaxID=2219695 RepID=UPI001F22A291|nr:glycosyltransferase family 2 protein [Luxibacter massiliensis]
MSRESMKPYFSIVMPVYGVEQYISRAISSVQEQTFEAWEIILVDDCSPDKSAAVAEEFARDDQRIRIVSHKENKGLSGARNTGIQEAKGAYIWFMDPDDYVDGDLLERVKLSLEENPAEAVLFGLVEEYYGRDGDLEYTHSICPKEVLYQDQAELRKAVISLEQQTLYGYAWNKIYNLEYLKERRLAYEDVKLIEDILFNVKYFMDIERLNVLGFTPYHYGKRMNASLTNKFVPEYFRLHRQRIEMLFDQYSYWNLCTSEVRQVLGSLYGRYILSALERNCDRRSGMSHVDRYRWCRALFCQGLFNELIPCAKARDSKALSIALVFLRWKKTILCLAMGRGVHIVRGAVPMLYSRVKSGR